MTAATSWVCATSARRRCPPTTTLVLVAAIVAFASPTLLVVAQPAAENATDTGGVAAVADTKVADELLLVSTKVELNRLLNNARLSWRSRLASVSRVRKRQ